jgi:chemotaxis-related protein WspB
VLFIVFTIGQDWCASPAADIVQIVPDVTPSPLLGSPNIICGMMRYRGQIIPLIDLGLHFTGSACAKAATTRILILARQAEGQRSDFIGLRAERVTSTVHLSDSVFAGGDISAVPFLSGITIAGDGILVRRFDARLFLTHVASCVDARAGVA